VVREVTDEDCAEEVVMQEGVEGEGFRGAVQRMAVDVIGGLIVEREGFGHVVREYVEYELVG